MKLQLFLYHAYESENESQITSETDFIYTCSIFYVLLNNDFVKWEYWNDKDEEEREKKWLHCVGGWRSRHWNH